ncbi:MAG: hypothetical protein BWY42_00465 [Candidatus Omnitrophica bacterium ADurb.Bin277]|nr:MAG: hypothetical protein BWY42_00465 [Candidatus Omnitrophica bacterium ADurb.Bin277]
MLCQISQLAGDLDPDPVFFSQSPEIEGKSPGRCSACPELLKASVEFLQLLPYLRIQRLVFQSRKYLIRDLFDLDLDGCIRHLALPDFFKQYRKFGAFGRRLVFGKLVQDLNQVCFISAEVRQQTVDLKKFPGIDGFFFAGDCGFHRLKERFDLAFHCGRLKKIRNTILIKGPVFYAVVGARGCIE